MDPRINNSRKKKLPVHKKKKKQKKPSNTIYHSPAKSYTIIQTLLPQIFSRRGRRGKKKKKTYEKETEPTSEPPLPKPDIQPSSHSVYTANNRLVINSRIVRPPRIHRYGAHIGIDLWPVPSIDRKFSHCHFGRANTKNTGWDIYIYTFRSADHDNVDYSVDQFRRAPNIANVSYAPASGMRLARRVQAAGTISSSGIERGGEEGNGGGKKTRACRCISPHVTWIERQSAPYRDDGDCKHSPAFGAAKGGGESAAIEFLGTRFSIRWPMPRSRFPRITATFGLSRGRAKWDCKHVAPNSRQTDDGCAS